MCVMKLNKYFMMGAMGLSLVACSDNLDENGQSANGTNPNEGTTYVALKIDFNSSSSRAGEQPVDGDTGVTPPTYNDGEEGNEGVLNTVTIVVTDQATNRVEYCQTYSGQTLAADNKYVFPIEPGVKNFFAYANQTISASVGGQWTGTETSDANVATLAPYESQQTGEGESAAWTKWFAMSSAVVVSQTIEDDVEKAEVDESNNVVSIEIERMVAKVTAQLATKFDGENPFSGQAFTVSAITARIGNADNLSYNGTTMDAGAASYYIAQNNESGARITPYYNYPNKVTWGSSFDESDLLWGEEEDAEDLYTPTVADNKTPQVRFYCKENTHVTYVQSNTTFLRIVATMYPNAVVQFACTTAEDTKTISVSAGTAPSAVGTFYRVLNTNDGQHVGTYVMASQLAELYGTEDSDVTTGEETETDAKAAAVVAELENNYNFEFSEPYVGGNGYYNVWVNDLREENTNRYLNIAPVFRNDWYDLTINNIQLPGDPDPTIDPEEPIHPNTFVAVTLTVRDWNKVSHNVDLQ